MKILFVTFDMPFPVRYGGQVYTGNVIRELGKIESVSTTVVCFDANILSESRYGAHGVEWITIPQPQPNVLKLLFSVYPTIATRFKSATFQAAVEREIAVGQYDLVILDYIAVGWLLPVVRKAASQLPALMLTYMSHNVETELRDQIAKGIKGNILKKIAARFDAWRAYRLEKLLVERSDFSSAETDEDIAAFKRLFSARPLIKLAPGYDGRLKEERSIVAADAKNVVVLGGRLSTMKQIVLDSFLEQAAQGLADAGFNVHVVGPTTPGYLKKCEERYPFIEFHGFVEDVEPLLEKMGFGIIADHVGGGFKHRLLTYVFHRVPMVSVESAMAGMPLLPEEDYVAVKEYSEIPGKLKILVNNTDLLNKSQESSYGKCFDLFSWERNVGSYIEEVEGILTETRKPAH